MDAKSPRFHVSKGVSTATDDGRHERAKPDSAITESVLRRRAWKWKSDLIDLRACVPTMSFSTELRQKQIHGLPTASSDGFGM
ncbi:hypothetical protein [Caballeronia calidae]|uniref:hypothetical protein n=1 Tax=Caballeronia calidae TaxID=1777139 RepID=UPI0012FDD9C3|nr:hypothetical protein [Caballeronia calidae]